MRRFHADHEGVMPQNSLLALWRCDEATGTATLSDSAYSATFFLVKEGVGASSSTAGLYNPGSLGGQESLTVSSNQTMHLDANAVSFLSLTGALVDDWRSSTGASTNLHCPGGSGTRPTWVDDVVNGLDVVRWDNDDEGAVRQSNNSTAAALLFTSSHIFSRTAFTFYAVISPSTITTTAVTAALANVILGTATNNDGGQIYLTGSASPVYNVGVSIYDDTSATLKRVTTPITSGAGTFSVVVARLLGNNLSIKVNTGAFVDLDVTGVDFGNSVQARVGNSASGVGNTFWGDMALMSTYKEAHDDATVTGNVDFLMSRFGI